MYDNPFAEEVRTNPYDDTPRLIFADFLDDNGDPLGQLIRVQIALTEYDPDDDRRTPLEKQEQALIAEHAEHWLAPLRRFGAEGLSSRCFQRGLIERIRISAENFLQHADELCLHYPALHTLCLTNIQATPQLDRAQLPKQIRGLDLSTSNLQSLENAGFNWPMMTCIEQLTELNLRLTRATDRAIGQLCTRNLSNLQRLDLTACGLTSSSGAAIAACPTLTNLRTLKLALNQLVDSGVAALGRSPFLNNLAELDLASNQIGDSGVQALAQAGALVALQRLNLRANVIHDKKWASVTNFKNMGSLKVVDLRNN